MAHLPGHQPTPAHEPPAPWRWPRRFPLLPARRREERASAGSGREEETAPASSGQVERAPGVSGPVESARAVSGTKPPAPRIAPSEPGAPVPPLPPPNFWYALQAQTASRLGRALAGAAAALVPVGITLVMHPAHRTPYLLAYPAVVLCAWVGGVPAAVGCAAAAGVLIEHFLGHTRNTGLLVSLLHGSFREGVFVAGSVMVGLLTRTAARERERAARAEGERELALAAAESRASRESARAAELDLENEVRARLALDGANAGTFQWDIQQDISRWSSGFFRLHDLDPSAEMHYRTWRSCVHPDDIARVEAELLAAVRELGSFAVEYRVRLGSGEVRWIGCQGSTQTDAYGTPTVLTGFCGDMTRRKQTEAAMLQSEKLAMAGRLSAAVAHEIKDPLEAAINLVYLSRQNPGSEEALLFQEEALGQLEAIAEISRQTLRLIRPADRAITCHAPALLQTTLSLLKAKLLMANVQVGVEIRSEVPFCAAPGEMQQVFTNLINNALEAMDGTPGGRVRIRIQAVHQWSKGGTYGVRISFADNASGMTPEVLRRMRDTFFTTKAGTGTGLGMWVVTELLANHGGSFRVSSSTNPGHRGTVVSVFLPASAADEPAHSL